MKIDKELIVAFIVCAVILFGWEPFAKYMGWIKAPVAVETTVTAPQSQPTPAESTPTTAAKPVTAAPIKASKPLKTISSKTLQNDRIALRFSPLSGTIDSITLKNFLNASRTTPIELDQTLTASGALSLYEPDVQWQVTAVPVNKSADDTYRLVRDITKAGGATFKLEQSWKLVSDSYITDCTIHLTNTGKQPALFTKLVFNGGDLAPWPMISGDTIRVDSHRVDFMTEKGKFFDIKADDDDEDFFQTPAPLVKWVGIGNKYFACVLTSEQPFYLYQARINKIVEKTDNQIVTIGASIPGFTLQPGESKEFSFRYFTGPKETALLSGFDSSTARMMHLAWGPLDYLARLLLWMLVQLHSFCGSYGISIILLTLIVRLLFYPVTAKANASMKRMQSIAPKVTALREKYKDNPQMLNSKTMELYRQEKVNPFGGCLPILLQIPVFFALYATLEGAVQLRQVSFLWATDLAGPDTVATIPLYFYNLPINPLVLAMTALMVIQQRMTPMAMDPMQKKMMMAMPIVMLVFLYNLPSGLTLYWTVSNLFSIIQLKLQQRSNATAEPAPAKKGA